jgi:hypothetical protein
MSYESGIPAGSGITEEALKQGYHGDAPYPDDDHSLGEHEPVQDFPECRRCRAVAKRIEEETE